MSYEGFYIDKHSSCWILKHSDPQVGMWQGKTKQECLRYLAMHFLQLDQDILAEAYQEKMREQGEDYSRNDSLDALIHEASHSSKNFIEVLRPELKKQFEASGRVTIDVEIVE